MSSERADHCAGTSRVAAVMLAVVMLGACTLRHDRASVVDDNVLATLLAEVCLCVCWAIAEQIIEGVEFNGDYYAEEAVHEPPGKLVVVTGDSVVWGREAAGDDGVRPPPRLLKAIPESWRDAYHAGFVDRWRDLSIAGTAPMRWVDPASNTPWARWYRRGWCDATTRYRRSE